MPHPDPAQKDRRLYRRYQTGLAAELVVAGERLGCRIADISLGGAAVELDSGSGRHPASGEAVLCSAEIGAGFPLPVRVMHMSERQAHLAFAADEAAEHELTIFLLDSAAMQETRPAPARAVADPTPPGSGSALGLARPACLR